MRIRAFIIGSIATLFLAACGANAAATPLPTVVLENTTKSTPAPAKAAGSAGSSGVAASGVVVPAREAKLAFTLGGSVKAVNIAVGDQVQAGQTLAELEQTSIQLELDQAQRTLKELTSAASIAETEQAIATARQTVKDTQDKADGLFYARASDTLIKNTQGDIDLAKQALSRAADSYRQVSRLPDGDTKKALALVAMTNAQLNLNALVAKYNWYTSSPTEIDAALVKANLAAAQAALQEEQWYLAAIKGEAVPAEATGSQLAQLKQVKDTVVAAQDKLAKSRLTAPFEATVSQVELVVGEYATPGKVVVVLSDLNPLLVETTDLSERDVPKVQVGQAVNVFIEAINENVPGKVTLIAPTSETLGGDVVYKTTIELESLPEGLRAGMSAEVQYGALP